MACEVKRGVRTWWLLADQTDLYVISLEIIVDIFHQEHVTFYR